MKILPVGAKLRHADGRTDGQIDIQAVMTKLSFSRFCKRAPKPTKTWCCKQTPQLYFMNSQHVSERTEYGYASLNDTF